jgi:seryl-tRNA synthetase
MLDIKIIRNNPDLVKDSIRKRNVKLDLDKFLETDARKLELLVKVDELRAIKNKVSKEIPTLSDEEKNKKIAEMKIVSDEIKVIEEELKNINEEFNIMHRNIPNFLHSDIPE